MRLQLHTTKEVVIEAVYRILISKTLTEKEIPNFLNQYQDSYRDHDICISLIKSYLLFCKRSNMEFNKLKRYRKIIYNKCIIHHPWLNYDGSIHDLYKKNYFNNLCLPCPRCGNTRITAHVGFNCYCSKCHLSGPTARFRGFEIRTQKGSIFTIYSKVCEIKWNQMVRKYKNKNEEED
jgi:hypothetical protein